MKVRAVAWRFHRRLRERESTDEKQEKKVVAAPGT